jgi:hypothetical protein
VRTATFHLQDADLLSGQSLGDQLEGNCVTSISHKFDGKGMEITSELRLKNLTHGDIGEFQQGQIFLACSWM